MERASWVYIITDKPYGTLYTGVTSNLARRVWEHKTGVYPGFSKKYGLKLLVYYEEHSSINEAITREKCIKAWKREWKTHRISMFNPPWRDLYEDFNK